MERGVERKRDGERDMIGGKREGDEGRGGVHHTVLAFSFRLEKCADL